MTFENHKTGNGGYILMSDNNEELGRLTYTIFPEERRLVISFVMVHPKFGGQGNGKKLVEEAIAFARAHQWIIQPHCSYAKNLMNRMQTIEDVYPTSQNQN